MCACSVFGVRYRKYRDVAAAVIVEIFDPPITLCLAIFKTLMSESNRICSMIAIYHVQSSSASRVTAGALGFFTLTQCAERPERYGEPSRFDTMPSQPSAQASR